MKTRTDAAKTLLDQGWSYEDVKGVFDESDRLAGLAKLSDQLAKKQEHVEKMQPRWNENITLTPESDLRKSIINVKPETARGYFVEINDDILFKTTTACLSGEKILEHLFKVDPSINPTIGAFCLVEVKDGAVVKVKECLD